MESKYFLKKINSRIKLLIGIAIVLVSIFLEFLIIKDYNEEKKSAKPFLEATNFGEYVYIDVEDYTDYFATYTNGDTKQYYNFLYDGKYIYIGKVNPSNYSKLPGRLYGYTSTLSSDLVDIAIDEYNSFAGEEKLNKENFYDFLGIYYLDNYKSPTSDLIGISIFIAIALIIGIILIIVDIRDKSKLKNVLAKYDMEKLLREIDSKDTIANHRAKLYLTNKNIISYKSKLDIINYEDVVWIYPHTESYRGSTNASIIVMDKNSKNHSLGHMPLNKRTQTEFDELYVDLKSKLPHALSGYTAENMEKARNEVSRYSTSK